MKMTEQVDPRIGVFVCHCGHNIAGTVDVDAVAKQAESFPYVAFSCHEMFMCGRFSAPSADSPN